MSVSDVSELFRYVSVRDKPLRTPDRRREVGRLALSRNPEAEVPLHAELRSQSDKPDEQIALAKQFLEANEATGTELVTAIKARVALAFREPPAELDLRTLFGGGDPDAFGELLQSVILAWSFITPLPAMFDEAVRILKLWYLAHTDEVLDTNGTLSERLFRLPLFVSPLLHSPVGTDARTARARANEITDATSWVPADAEPTEQHETDKIASELDACERALAELLSGISSGRALASSREVRGDGAEGERPQPRGGDVGDKVLDRPRTRGYSERVKFSTDALSDDARRVIANVGGHAHDVESTIDAISTRATALRNTLAARRRRDRASLIVDNLLVRLPSTATAINAPAAAVAQAPGWRVQRHYLGVADLKLVKEELIAYELADFGHIENVLAGEEKERTHRRLETTEIETLSVTESEEESERDTQTTTRNEVAAEASTVAKETIKVEGNLSVSGSYGPTVEFTAGASAGYGSETTSSQKRSSAFAQEVVQKTVEKVRNRLLQQRRVKTLNEVEETNLHGVKNSHPGAQHVRGIYRWLNKISNAQVWDYGARHMFSFVIPEPAAFYLASMANNSTVIYPPVAPTITPADITRTSYQALVAEYGATGVTAPPEVWRHFSKVFKSEAKVAAGAGEAFHYSLAEVQKIERGYTAWAAEIHTDWVEIPNEGDVRYSLGPVTNGTNTWMTFPNPASRRWNEVAIGVQASSVITFYCLVDLFCWNYDDSETFQTWQLKTYDAIWEGYNRQLADYEEKIAAASIRQGIAISGRNPLENQSLIRNELKRTCLSLFFGVNFPGFNSFYSSDPADPGYWQMNTAFASALGYATTLWERAFEWDNMTYSHCPYYWGRQSEWSRHVTELSDPDPAFAAFIRAGATRVLVPARPEFAEALLYYAHTGTLPIGTEQLLSADDAIQAMIEEVRARGVDSVPGATKDGLPWETRLPTSLVLLQDPADIVLRDTLLGTNGTTTVSTKKT